MLSRLLLLAALWKSASAATACGCSSLAAGFNALKTGDNIWEVKSEKKCYPSADLGGTACQYVNACYNAAKEGKACTWKEFNIKMEQTTSNSGLAGDTDLLKKVRDEIQKRLNPGYDRTSATISKEKFWTGINQAEVKIVTVSRRRRLTAVKKKKAAPKKKRAFKLKMKILGPWASMNSKEVKEFMDDVYKVAKDVWGKDKSYLTWYKICEGSNCTGDKDSSSTSTIIGIIVGVLVACCCCAACAAAAAYFFMQKKKKDNIQQEMEAGQETQMSTATNTAGENGPTEAI